MTHCNRIASGDVGRIAALSHRNFAISATALVILVQLNYAIAPKMPWLSKL